MNQHQQSQGFRTKSSIVGKWIGPATKYIIRGVIIGVAINSVFNAPSYHEDSTTKKQINRELTVDQAASKVDHSKKKTELNPRQQSEEEWLCKWSPADDHKKQCTEIFSNRLPRATKVEGGNKNAGEESTSPDHRGTRWLFFGDSTMKRLFDRSDLKTILVQDPLAKSQDSCLGRDLSCKEREGDRCELNSLFGLPYAEKWIAPDPKLFEGPVKFGSENAYCTDCSTCQSHFLECRSMENKAVSSSLRTLSKEHPQKTLVTTPQCKAKDPQGVNYYGGFMSMEFARDTEIQTPEFRTTQENLAAYIIRTWNSPEMLKHWRKPICVLSAGNHDIMVHGIPTEKIVQNVKFMLTKMKPACDHMIWLGNTSSNRRSTFPQAKLRMLSLEKGIKEMLVSHPELLDMMSFVDVIDASLTYPHKDFIHMYDKWYFLLGEWFINIINMNSAIAA